MKHKKAWALLLAMVMCLSLLTACGSGGQSAGGTDTAAGTNAAKGSTSLPSKKISLAFSTAIWKYDPIDMMQGAEGRFQFASLHAQSEVQEVHRLRDPDDHFQIGADPLRIAAMADDHDFCHCLMRRNRWRSPVPSGRQPEPGWPASAS